MIVMNCNDCNDLNDCNEMTEMAGYMIARKCLE